MQCVINSSMFSFSQKVLSALVFGFFIGSIHWTPSSVAMDVYGKDNLEPVANLPSGSHYAQWATGVCSVGAPSTDSLGGCTGFLIAPDQLMTNYHCLGEIHVEGENTYRDSILSPALRAAIIGATTKLYVDPKDLQTHLVQSLNQNANQFLKAKCRQKDGAAVQVDFVKLLRWSRVLDFAIIQLKSPLSEKDHHMFKLQALEDSKKLEFPVQAVAIGFPSGEAYGNQKMIDRSEECRLTRREGETDNSFRHHCDTMPRSSGSPIIDHKSGEVLGLHFSGWNEDKPGTLNYNQAKEMGKITESLKSPQVLDNPKESFDFDADRTIL